MKIIRDLDTNTDKEFQCDRINLTYNGSDASVNISGQVTQLDPSLVNYVNSLNNARLILSEDNWIDITNIRDAVFSVVDDNTESPRAQIRIICDLLM